MRLYYMTQLETFEQHILPEQRIKISTFDRVNDPFELLGQIKNGNRKKHDFAKLRQHWTETYGFISFSDNWRSPLMWAHYASNHTGVCLGIDVKVETPHEIQYLPARSISDIDFTEFDRASDEDLFRQIATTKFDQWSYEREWRIFKKLDFDAKDVRLNAFFQKFSPDFELREIILGTRCTKTWQEMQKIVNATTAPVEIKKTRPAFRSFDMVPNYGGPLATVHPKSDENQSEPKPLIPITRTELYAKKFVEKLISR